MLELLVPPTAEQAATSGGRFDERARPALTVDAIDELAADGLRPDWWKLEGNTDPDAAAHVAAAGSRPPRSAAWCSVAGRTATASYVGSRSPPLSRSFVGFAVGRTLWTDPFAAARQRRDRRAGGSQAGSRPPTWTSRPLTAGGGAGRGKHRNG